jgi:hypothetical protein
VTWPLLRLTGREWVASEAPASASTVPEEDGEQPIPPSRSYCWSCSGDIFQEGRGKRHCAPFLSVSALLEHLPTGGVEKAEPEREIDDEDRSRYGGHSLPG